MFTVQTLPACEEPFAHGVGKVAGFSLHAGVAAWADQHQKPERLCRYISRPAISEKRLSLTPNGNVRYELKTPYRDGTTHVIFEPLDFIARLAALVPKPPVNLTHIHGVFAANSTGREPVGGATAEGPLRSNLGVSLAWMLSAAEFCFLPAIKSKSRRSASFALQLGRSCSLRRPSGVWALLKV